MRLAIMQPYFLPYIGYFQLIAAVDCFVVYDNIKYTKKGWINRNRMLLNGGDAVFSLPLRSGSDSLDVRERELSADLNRAQLLSRFKEAYRRAPHINTTFPLLERVFGNTQSNLFDFLLHSIRSVCEHLQIDTEIRCSSTIDIDHGLKSQAKVLALCEKLGAATYINPIGGTELYAKPDFAERGIELQFIRPTAVEYAQFDQPFVPWLSIIDVLMFNSVEQTRAFLTQSYELA